MTSLQRVLELGVDGLKFHPLHVVKGTQLANEWRRGEYQPLTMDEYVSDVVELINRTPDEVIFHRLTGTASPSVLLAPQWCSKKWQVLNSITAALSQQSLNQVKQIDSFGKINKSENESSALLRQATLACVPR